MSSFGRRSIWRGPGECASEQIRRRAARCKRRSLSPRAVPPAIIHYRRKTFYRERGGTVRRMVEEISRVESWCA